MSSWTGRSALVLVLIAAAGCSEGGSEAEGEGTAPVAGTEPGVEAVALSCEAAALYAGLGEWVVAYQRILIGRPQRDTYETDAQFAPRMAVWQESAAAAVDSAIVAHQPLTIRQDVRSYSYDAAAETLLIEDFGDLAVPGVVVDPALRLPYPSIHCATGPFLRCASHTSADAWRTEVVAHRVALETAADARVPVSRQLAESTGVARGPVEYEMTFALEEDTQSPLLPVARLSSLRLFVADQEIATWEGEATAAGRTTEQRLIAFTPEPMLACP